MTNLTDDQIEEILENNPGLAGKKIAIVFLNLPRNTLHSHLRESLAFQTGKYKFVIINANYSTSSQGELKEIQNINRLHDIAGYIIWPSPSFDQYAGVYLQENNIPFVLIPHISEIYEGKYNQVCTTTEATSLAIDHLVSQGARKIGFVIGEKVSNTSFVQQRYHSYINALKVHNLPAYDPITIPDTSEDQNHYKSHPEIARVINVYDGIFAATDFLMGLVYKNCIDAGIRIPDDILLTSIDNTIMSKCFDVTSIEQNFPVLAHQAVNRLVELILNPDEKPQQISIPSDLIIRGSSLK